MPRGSDFSARWNEGAWAEVRILETLNSVDGLCAVQFGISDGTAFWSIREMQARDLPDQNLHGKRPDILVFRDADLSAVERAQIGELCLIGDAEAEQLARRAFLAIESEFSPYDYDHRIREYGKELSFTLKEEDLRPLQTWTGHFGVPLGLVQVYLDSSYFLSFDTLVTSIENGTIRRQIERAYNKAVYYPPMSVGIRFASFIERPKIGADVVRDRYGKYTAFRKVDGGLLELTAEMRALLAS